MAGTATASSSLCLDDFGVGGTDSRTTPAVHHNMPFLFKVVRSPYFEVLIAVAILCNCVTVGIEAELLVGKAGNLGTFTSVSEQLFTAMFLCELFLRLAVFGPGRFIRKPLDFMDAVLVACTCLSVWLLPLFEAGGNFWRAFTVLRIGRLLRLVRVVRRVEVFHEVWLLLRGFKQSLKVLAGTIGVITFITYIFAVFGVVLIGTVVVSAHENAVAESIDASDEEVAHLAEMRDWVGSISGMMFTLVQVLTLDSWTSVARPVGKYVGWAWVYFYVYIAIAVVCLMNLVTAIVVDGALKHSKMDEAELLHIREESKKKELVKLEKLFAEIDVDGDGELTWREFKLAFMRPEICQRLKLINCHPDQCREIFSLLDSGDGVLSVDEFFDGIARMEGIAQAKDVFRIIKSVELVARLVGQAHEEICQDLDELVRNTPGATQQERKGNLKARARAHHKYDILSISRSASRTLTALGTKRLDDFQDLVKDLPEEPEEPSSEKSQTVDVSSKHMEVEKVLSPVPFPFPPMPGDDLMGRPVGLEDLVARLDQVVALVDLAMIEARERAITHEKKVEICSAKMDRLAIDLMDMKGTVGFCSTRASGANPAVFKDPIASGRLLGTCCSREESSRRPSFEESSDLRKQQLWPKPTPLI